jgi:flagellar motility protein MotE (MotC chaperone)
MLKILQSGWVTALIGGIAYCATTAVLIMSTPMSVTHTEAKEAPRKYAPSWEFFNPEVDLLVKELKHEKDALAAKAKELSELAARLDAERAELTVVTQAVHRMQAEFDRNVVRVKEEETTNLRRLGKVYSGMTPEGAALILKQMDDDQIVKILLFMKEAETGPLLENFARLSETEAKRAALVSDRLRTASAKPTSTPKS